MEDPIEMKNQNSILICLSAVILGTIIFFLVFVFIEGFKQRFLPTNKVKFKNGNEISNRRR